MTTSRAGRFVGVAAVAAFFVLTEWFVITLCGARPQAFLGLSIGTFLGLASLVLEMAMTVRAERTFYAQGVQTTFMSFMMRLATVGPLSLLFMKSDLGVDPQAFALSYCGTFLVYMCWLTWKTYHAPSTYRPKAKASVGEGIVVIRNGIKNARENVGEGVR